MHDKVTQSVGVYISSNSCLISSNSCILVMIRTEVKVQFLYTSQVSIPETKSCIYRVT